MESLINVKPSKNMTFELYECKYNLRSCFALCMVDLISCISYIAVINLNLVNIKYNPIILILTAYLGLWFTSYLLFLFFGNTQSYSLNRIFFISYLLPVFILHTMIAVFSKDCRFGLIIYPTYILSNCVFFSLKTIESVILYLPLTIIFMFHLALRLPKGYMLNIMLFSIVFANLLAFVYSMIKHDSSKKVYNTYIMLLTAIDDRDDSNEKLKMHEKYITDFFINISHDLKAPLNIIYSSEQLLEKQFQNKNIDYNKAEKYITSIKLNSIRLTRLLNNILDISKIDAAKFSLSIRNLDIVTTVEGIIDSLVDFMNSKGIALSFDTDFEEMILALDEEKLERIILNLLSNALKFTPDGGKISVKLYDDDNFVFVSIKDTGTGIDEETQRNIFDRFVQGSLSPNNNMSGSGIGLSLVKSLMTLHGGEVTLDSQLGVGSTFILKFPKSNLAETLDEDISTGSIYPNINASSAFHLEFAGLVKDQLKDNATT